MHPVACPGGASPAEALPLPCSTTGHTRAPCNVGACARNRRDRAGGMEGSLHRTFGPSCAPCSTCLTRTGCRDHPHFWNALPTPMHHARVGSTDTANALRTRHARGPYRFACCPRQNVCVSCYHRQDSGAAAAGMLTCGEWGGRMTRMVRFNCAGRRTSTRALVAAALAAGHRRCWCWCCCCCCGRADALQRLKLLVERHILPGALARVSDPAPLGVCPPVRQAQGKRKARPPRSACTHHGHGACALRTGRGW